VTVNEAARASSKKYSNHDSLHLIQRHLLAPAIVKLVSQRQSEPQGSPYSPKSLPSALAVASIRTAHHADEAVDREAKNHPGPNPRSQRVSANFGGGSSSGGSRRGSTYAAIPGTCSGASGGGKEGE